MPPTAQWLEAEGYDTATEETPENQPKPYPPAIDAKIRIAMIKTEARTDRVRIRWSNTSIEALTLLTGAIMLIGAVAFIFGSIIWSTPTVEEMVSGCLSGISEDFEGEEYAQRAQACSNIQQ